jgi:sarcosine oxidase subunit beta
LLACLRSRVEIFEQAPGLGYGSSGYSTGFLRAYYSFDETMQLALDGIGAYKAWDEYTQLGDEADASFTETGALWMLGYREAENKAMVERLGRFGVTSEVMDADDVAKKWPCLDTSPFPEFNDEGDEVVKDLGEFSAVHEHGCGHMDSNLCLSDMKKVLDREGVKVHMSTPVDAFETTADGSKVTGVKLGGSGQRAGEVVAAGTVVNCAGPWFGKLNDKSSVKTSTEMLPTRIHVGHKHIEGEYLDLPFVADGWGNSGIYFMPRRQNSQLVFGSVAHRFESEVVDPDDYNTSLDPDVKQDYLTCLFHRLPGMPRSGQIHGFAHMYTVNQDDVHPVVGESEVDNLFLAYGESGHGFKLAPAIGALLAQQITGQTTSEWETTCPHDFLHPAREPLSLKVKTHFA